jgi:hypothetical protein
MNTLRHAGLAAVLGLCLCGCATRGERSGTTETAALPTTRAVTAQAVKDGITPGKSSKADVIAALGPTTRIQFDSGFEVWVYRYANDGVTGRGGAELVVLFTPSGVASKTRIRHATATEPTARP